MLRLAALLAILSAPALAQSPLVFPVAGVWFAVKGPPCESCTPNLALGLGLVPVDPFGRPANGCFDRPVLSPTEGSVIAVGDSDIYGHHIAIARSETETMVLGFLAKGSVTVAPGDRVAAGVEIARCRGPSFHVHMQASRDILDPEAEGLPMSFSNLDVRTPGGCLPTPLLFRGQGTC